MLAPHPFPVPGAAQLAQSQVFPEVRSVAIAVADLIAGVGLAGPIDAFGARVQRVFAFLKVVARCVFHVLKMAWSRCDVVNKKCA